MRAGFESVGKRQKIENGKEQKKGVLQKRRKILKKSTVGVEQKKSPKTGEKKNPPCMPREGWKRKTGKFEKLKKTNTKEGPMGKTKTSVMRRERQCSERWPFTT